jgi:hypothetical protein
MANLDVVTAVSTLSDRASHIRMNRMIALYLRFLLNQIIHQIITQVSGTPYTRVPNVQ